MGGMHYWTTSTFYVRNHIPIDLTKENISSTNQLPMTKKELRLTKGIHSLVRNKLTWEESWNILSEVVESKEWISYWEIESLLNLIYSKKQDNWN